MKSSKEKLVGALLFGLFLGYFLHRFVKIGEYNYHGDVGQMFIKISQSNEINTHPLDLAFTSYSFFAFICGIGLAMLIYLARIDNRTYLTGKEYGSARHATLKEMEKFRNKEFKKNVILGQKARISRVNSALRKKFKRNNNTLVLGASGTAKTYRFVKPNLAQAFGSYILTDSKGMTVHETGKFFEEEGYAVKIFDLINMTGPSDTFNPFCYVRDELTLRTLLSLLITGTDGEVPKQGDPFWDKAEVVLSEALMGYCWRKAKARGEQARLYQINELVRNLRSPDPKVKSVVEILFEQYEKEFGEDDYYAKKFRTFKGTFAGDTLNSVLAIVGSRFDMFEMPQIKRLIDSDTVELDKIALRPTILYINIPDYDTTFNFLATIMFSMLNLTLFYQADVLYNGEVPVPVSVHADEYANYSNIYRMENFTAVNRSRNISMNLYLQDINQLKKKHEKDWRTIVSNSDTLVFLGGAEEDTTKLISKKAGKTTIYEKDYERLKDGHRNNKPRPKGRDLYDEHEVATLDNEKMLVFIRGMNVFEDTKYIAENHPNWKRFAYPGHNGQEGKPLDPNWYEWKRYDSKVDEWLDNTSPEDIDILNEDPNEVEFLKQTLNIT